VTTQEVQRVKDKVGREAVVDRFESAFKVRDGSALEYALGAARRGASRRRTYRYESHSVATVRSALASGLRRRSQCAAGIGDESTVAALESAALVRYPYLAFDENRGLASKCTWVLADIGTGGVSDSRARLAAGSDFKDAAYASRRLRQWDAEFSRKRG
jgi:hypothetical protein